MIKIYQECLDRYKGDCMRATVASILELSLRDVPNFILYGDKWWDTLLEFMNYYGYILNKEHPIIDNSKGLYKQTLASLLNEYEGIHGLFLASVYSPKYYSKYEEDKALHAIIINKNIEIVHDPNPNYQNVYEYPESNILGYNGIYDIWNFESINRE